MDLFDVSEWSVNSSSDRLNKKLFGTLQNERSNFSKKDGKNNHKDLKRKSDIDGNLTPKKSKKENKVKQVFESKPPGMLDAERLKTEGKCEEQKSSKKKDKAKRNVNQTKGSDTESSLHQTRALNEGNKNTRQCSTNGRVKDKQEKGSQHIKFSVDVLEKSVLGDSVQGIAGASGGSEPLTKKQKRKLKEKKRIQRKKQERLAREAARNDSTSQRMKQSSTSTRGINPMKNPKKKITDTMKLSFGCEKFEGDTVKSPQQVRKPKKKSSKKNKYKHLANNKADEENDSNETCDSKMTEEAGVVTEIGQKCSAGSDKVKNKKRKHQKDLKDGGIHQTEVVFKKKKRVEEMSTKHSFKKKEHEHPETCIEKKIKTPKELSLRERMMDKLNSARFRYLNEQMYTSSGKEAEEMFMEDVDAYKVYHDGFQTQVGKWPVNPLDEIITQLKKVDKDITIADMGCGEAKLAKKLQNMVHSFDLVALNERVTVANISKVPLQARSVDIVVFCLSLMGTNLVEYITEANRILKNGGIMKIAEVMSRFKEGLNQFVANVEKVGFNLLKKDKSNQYFVMFEFKKTGSKKQHVPDIALAPCIYKKR